jgi:hypothetical protein
VHRTELNMANMAVVAPETVSTLIVLLSPLVVALLLFVYLQAVQKMKRARSAGTRREPR